MRIVFRLDRSASGRFIWQQSYMTGGLRSFSRASGTVGLLHLGLRAIGAPRSVTEVTGLLAEANLPATVFSGFVAGGSSIQALAIYGRDAGAVIQGRNLSAQHGTVVQGYSLITTLIFGSDEQRGEAIEMMTGEAAARRDYGFAVKSGLFLKRSVLEPIFKWVTSPAPPLTHGVRFLRYGEW